MNKIIRALIKYCGVKVVHKAFGKSCYVLKDRTIFIGVVRTLMTPIRFLLDRPTDAEYSLAHELGHAFFYKKRLQRLKGAQELFGDFDQEYFGTKGMVLTALTTMRDGYVTIYAKSHPLEDFAECFAFLILNHNEVPSWARGTVKTKMEYIKRRVDQALQR